MLNGADRPARTSPLVGAGLDVFARPRERSASREAAQKLGFGLRRRGYQGVISDAYTPTRSTQRLEAEHEIEDRSRGHAPEGRDDTEQDLEVDQPERPSRGRQVIACLPCDEPAPAPAKITTTSTRESREPPADQREHALIIGVVNLQSDWIVGNVD